MQRKILLLCLLTIFSLFAYSQEGFKVSGKVMDEKGKPMIGVNIVEKGTTTGTVTDIDGNYSITISGSDATIVFSYVGYLSEEVSVENENIIDITMVPDLHALTEMVVIGYGAKKKSDLTGAISSVNSDEINDAAYGNINQALQGKASGVEVLNSSGSPGSGTTMRIRGMGTLNSGAQPLYVIDGFIQGDQSFGKEGGERPDNKVGIGFLDPADIESVEILKDASAAAIYGARGANGVVLITTKKGKKGEPRVDLNLQYGMQYLPHEYPVMNAVEFREYMNTYNTKLGRDTLPGFRSGEDLNHFNWQDFVFDPASKQKYKLTVSGGSDKATYLVSGNYFKQEGIVQNSGLDKYSLRLNTTQNIGKRIKTGQNLIVTYSSRNRINENGTGLNASPIANALKADPSATPYYSDEEMDSLEIDEELNWGQWRELDRTPAVSNPASNLDIKSYIYDSWHYFGTAFFDIEILPSLVFHSTFGLDLNTGHMEEFEPFYKVTSVEKNPRTIFRLREEEWLNWDSENTLTFQKVFGNHDITAMAGFTAQKERFEDLRHTAVGFPYLEESLRYMNLTDPDILTEVKSSPMSYAFLSILGRVMYAYSDKILVTASIRRDGSSYFAEKYRYGYFPSYSLGYKISEEGFFQGLGLPINLLKFRAGYGELGNAAIRPNLFNPLMTNHTVGAAFNDPKEFYTGAMPEGLTNEDARWETTKQYNFAMDLGLWKNKFTFTFDYFIKQTEDLLIQFPLPKMSGAQNLERVGGDIPPLFVNAANMDNKGFEITTNYNFSLGDLRVSVSGNFSHVQNNVKSLADGLPIQSNQVMQFGGFLSKTEAGLPVASYYGYVVEGIYQSYDEIQEHLSEDAANVDPYTYDRSLEPNPVRNIAPGDYKFKDIDNNGIINSDDREYIGSPLPDFTYGGAINGQYKSLDFSLSLAGVQGNEVVNVMDFYLASYGGTNKYKGYSDTWSTDNTDAKYPRMETDVNDNRRFSTAYIEDGSYLKINNFTIGFTLPDNLVQRVNISKTRAYFTVSNLYTFTKYSTGYPEVGLSTRYNAKPLDFGVDRLVYPLPRVFMLGLDVSF